MNLTEALKVAAAMHPDDLKARSEELGRLAASNSHETLVVWKRDYEGLLARTNTWGLWGAAFVIGSGCSDDGFIDFRTALPAFGVERVNLAISDPDSLADLKDKTGSLKFEGFHYPLSDALQRAGVEGIVISALAEPVGTAWAEDELPCLFPRLWALCSRPEDSNSLISCPENSGDFHDPFIAFLSCYLVMTDSLTMKKRADYAVEIAAMKSGEELPDYFWRALRTNVERDWISPKKKKLIFQFICDGFSWCSSFVIYQDVFGVSAEGLPVIDITWQNYKRFSQSLDLVISGSTE